MQWTHVASVLIVTAGGLHGAEPAVVESRPQRATVYQDGYCYFEESMQLDREGGIALRLPPQTELSSITVLLEGAPLAQVTTQREFVRVQTDNRITEQTTGHLLQFPAAVREQVAGRGVVVRYGVKGVTWEPLLEAVLGDDERLTLTLKALVTNEAAPLRNCEIHLAAPAGPVGSNRYFAPQHRHSGSDTSDRAAAVLYHVGAWSLEKHASLMTTVASERIEYKMQYLWDTRVRERVQALLSITNPFDVPLCPASTSIFRNNVLLAQDESDWSPPGEALFLRAGVAAGIEVQRGVETTESDEMKERRFNHAIQLKLASALQQPAVVEVLFEKKTGYSHRTDYHFGREPDRRPGSLLVWDVRLEPGKSEVLEFDFDSDRPRYSEYETYAEAAYAF